MMTDEVRTVGKPKCLSKFELNDKGVFLDGKELNGVTEVVIRACAGELDEVSITMRVDCAAYSGGAVVC